jgi:hypothetical protein
VGSLIFAFDVIDATRCDSQLTLDRVDRFRLSAFIAEFPLWRFL